MIRPLGSLTLISIGFLLLAGCGVSTQNESAAGSYSNFASQYRAYEQTASSSTSSSSGTVNEATVNAMKQCFSKVNATLQSDGCPVPPTTPPSPVNFNQPPPPPQISASCTPCVMFSALQTLNSCLQSAGAPVPPQLPNLPGMQCSASGNSSGS